MTVFYCRQAFFFTILLLLKVKKGHSSLVAFICRSPLENRHRPIDRNPSCSQPRRALPAARWGVSPPGTPQLSPPPRPVSTPGRKIPIPLPLHSTASPSCFLQRPPNRTVPSHQLSFHYYQNPVFMTMWDISRGIHAYKDRGG